jgi:flagellar hook-associated protein 2
MATTAVSSSTGTTTSATTATQNGATTAAQTAAANKAAAQSLISSLGAGSGVDVAALAQNLVNAERVPQENAINAKITKNDGRVSGITASMFMLGELNTALADLKDKKDFNSIAISGGNSSAYTITPGTSTALGDYGVKVVSLYKAQKTISDSFNSTTALLNGGNAFQLNLATNGVASTPISVTTTTPAGVVSAINGANLGVKAEVVNTGTSDAPAYQIVLTGTGGASGAFTISATQTDGTSALAGTNMGFGATPLQAASDAEVKVNGVTYKRSTNAITDVIAGATINLKGASSTEDLVSLTRDNTALQAKFQKVVTAYNDAQSLFKEVTNPKSTLDTYGATLVGDATIRSVAGRLRSVFMGSSSTPGTSVNQLWQMGISFDATGVMKLDSTKLDTALTNNFDDVVKSLTGNYDDLSKYSPAKAGFFGDATYKITALVSPTGILASQSDSVAKQTTGYKESLTKLDTRMQSLLTRYNKQFASMQSFVGSANSQKTSLKSTFDGMMSIYTNKN